MRKLLFVSLFLLLPTAAMAQDVAANKTAVKSAPKAEEKAKPVILDKSKLQEMRLNALELENAQYKLKEAQAVVQKAQDSIADFWKSVGINPAELQTKWEASNGQNGDIVLTPKADKKIEEKPKTP